MCKFKVGDEVKTRNGRDVEIVYIDERLKHPIIGVLHYEDGEMTIQEWSDNGAFLGTKKSDLDLIPPSRTVTLYKALVRTPDGYYSTTGRLYQSEDDKDLQYFNTDGYKVVRLLTEYPIEVEL